MKTIFAYKGLVWRILNFLTDIIFLSLIWIICSLPLVTAGAATTALYDAVAHGIRNKEGRAYKRFFECFKREFKTATLSVLLWGAVAAAGLFLLYSLRQLGNWMDSATVAAAAWYVVLVLPLGAGCWAFPVLSRFTFSFAELNRTAFKLALGHLPSTAILVLLVIEISRLCIQYYFLLFVAPSLLMLLASLFIEPVFGKYGGALEKHEDDEGLPPENERI